MTLTDKQLERRAKKDLVFLLKYEASGFGNATAVYREMYGNARFPSQDVHLVIERNKEWLQSRFNKITEKTNERQARYILRLEKVFFDDNTKSTAQVSAGRILLQSAGALDEDIDSTPQHIKFTVSLTERPKDKEEE